MSREISARLRLTHLQIDVFNNNANPKLAAANAASAIDGGWVIEVPEGAAGVFVAGTDRECLGAHITDFNGVCCH